MPVSAEARHHEARIKAKARSLGQLLRVEDKWITPKWIGQIAHHRGALCSCHRCGNPRRWNKERTLDELRNDDIQREFKDFQK